jgi:hypothetical protein
MTDERIDLTNVAECRRWSERFGVSEEALRRAVAEAGDRAADVERVLAPGPGDTSTNGASHWRKTSGL